MIERIDDGRGKNFFVLARTPAAVAGLYRCGHHNEELGPEEATGAHSINFPRGGLYVKHARGVSSTVDPTRIVFFHRDEPFRTSHPEGCGDHGRYLWMRTDVLLDVVRRFDPASGDRPVGPYRHTDAPIDARVELAQELFFRALEHGGPVDALELEEAALDLVEAALARAYASRGGAAKARPDRRARTRRAHRELADAVRVRLVRDPCAALRLEELAREHGTSMFHLSRVFRAETGLCLSDFRRRLRLARSLELVADGARDLTRVALELGFASHSHFTTAFRSRFGTTPSRLRATARRARIADARAALRARAPRDDAGL